jgi:RNA polymerase sigma factor (TIGR02999 family)
VKTPPPPEFTQLLLAWSNGEEEALEKLVPLKLVPVVYQELRRMASRYMSGERPNHTLQTTALVHEAYLRLLDSRQVRWQNRGHFFAVSAQLMRRILVDFARSRRTQKRGAGADRVTLDEAVHGGAERDRDLVALDDALETLSTVDDRKAKVVELRFFGGLSVEETGDALGISADTVMRDWKLAKAWLFRELGGEARVE